MTWLLWRQHRAQALVFSVAIALFAIAVLVTGVHMAHVYDRALRDCAATSTCDFVGNLFQGYGAIVDTVHLTLAVPVVLGGLGAVLIAREYEAATNGLVWTQTVTRRRWVFTKVATTFGIALVVGATVSALVTWWSGTPNALYGNRFEGAQFDTQNIVPVAYALFAVAVGIAVGAVLRRTVPALATTVGAYAAVRVGVSVYLRPHYLAPITRSFPFGPGSGGAIPSGSQIVSRHIVDAAGHAADGPIPIPAGCAGVTRAKAPQCLSQLGYRVVTKYQPPSHYWSFQWIEAAIFVGLAAVLTAVAIVYTLRRDA